MAKKKAAAKAVKSFPDEIFVNREDVDTEDSFLTLSESTEEIAEKGKTIAVARYALVETLNVTTRVEVTPTS